MLEEPDAHMIHDISWKDSGFFFPLQEYLPEVLPITQHSYYDYTHVAKCCFILNELYKIAILVFYATLLDSSDEYRALAIVTSLLGCYLNVPPPMEKRLLRIIFIMLFDYIFYG